MSTGFTTIEVKGRTVGLTFGIPAIKRITEKTADIELFKEEKDEHGKVVNIQYTEAGMTHILYAGYLNNCYAEDEKPFFKFRDFTELLEEAVLDISKVDPIRDALHVFEESKVVKSMLPTEKEPVKKKNGTGTKLKDSAMVS